MQHAYDLQILCRLRKTPLVSNAYMCVFDVSHPLYEHFRITLKEGFVAGQTSNRLWGHTTSACHGVSLLSFHSRLKPLSGKGADPNAV